MVKKLLNIVKSPLLAAAAAIALLVATYSSAACFIFVVNQRNCPKSLIKVD